MAKPSSSPPTDLLIPGRLLLPGFDPAKMPRPEPTRFMWGLEVAEMLAAVPPPRVGWIGTMGLGRIDPRKHIVFSVETT